MRIGVDTGGTFTDIVVLRDGKQWLFKAPTTPRRPIEGILDGLNLAAGSFGVSTTAFMAQTDVLIHGTTHPLNAVITGNTARTALVVTRGHRDILTLREGGRADPFDKINSYPRSYIPRKLTFEIDERVLASGEVDRVLTDEALSALGEQIAAAGVDAVAVCLLWSVRNPAHEQAIKSYLAGEMPAIEVSISSDVNPALREFRRASATAIDASLKSFVRRYVDDLENDLRAAGLAAPVLLVGSDGSLMAPAQAVERPIALINSGPAMAPHAVLTAMNQADRQDLIVSDTGGTTFDVSLVRQGVIPVSSETYVGSPRHGLFCGYPSVDVQSVGAGGGSIAWVDEGGLLRLGPQSAGAEPGPACYGRGGSEPTLTDAALVRGIINPKRFLGGRLPLRPELAEKAIGSVARSLALNVQQAAARIMTLADEAMAGVVEEAIVRHGVDPKQATFVGGGGAAGLNVVSLARMLGCPRVLFPFSSSVLSAFGMTIAAPSAESRAVLPVRSSAFDMAKITDVLRQLTADAESRLTSIVDADAKLTSEYFVSARYEGQAWEIEIRFSDLRSLSISELVNAFHARHLLLYSFADPSAVVEFLSWRARVKSEARPGIARQEEKSTAGAVGRRDVYLQSGVTAMLPIYNLAASAPIEGAGPAIVETEYSTIFIEDAHRFRSASNGDLEIRIDS